VSEFPAERCDRRTPSGRIFAASHVTDWLINPYVDVGRKVCLLAGLRIGGSQITQSKLHIRLRACAVSVLPREMTAAVKGEHLLAVEYVRVSRNEFW
jgi:hypothetical protein